MFMDMESKKKAFTEPIIEIDFFEAADIIASSGETVTKIEHQDQKQTDLMSFGGPGTWNKN